MATPNSFRNSANSGQLQALWRSPSAIAAIASLGLHGLLFIVLPLLPHGQTKAKEADIKDPVALTELTPAEQKRLPAMVTLPPVELPPIASAPKNGSLFTLPSLSQPNTRTSITPNNSFSDSLLAPPAPLPIFIPPITPPTQFPSFSTIQIAPVQPAPVRIQPKAPPSPPAASPASPSPGASPSVAVESPPASPAAANPATGDQTAAGLANPQPSPARTTTDIRRDLLARQQELRQLYEFKPEGTSAQSANSAFLSWYSAAMGKDYAEGEAKPNQEEMTADYPKVGCPLKKDQRAVVGVVVDADNKILGDPKLLQSSGYGLFNQEALQAAKAHPFKNASGSQQVYLLNVKFEYREADCPTGLPAVAPEGQPAG